MQGGRHGVEQAAPQGPQGRVPRPAAGRFVTFEGIDGAGKSSHIEAAAQWLRARGRRVLVTREPGGTPLAEALREIVLHQPMDALTEALLVFAARRDHLVRRIEPALAEGQDVLVRFGTDIRRLVRRTRVRGAVVDIAFDELNNLGASQNTQSNFGVGQGILINGKSVIRNATTAAIFPDYMFLAVPTSSEGPGVIDVISMTSGYTRFDTDKYLTGVQSVPCSGARFLCTFFRH